MKAIIRTYLIDVGVLWLVSQSFPSLMILGGVKGLLIGGLAFMLANVLLVPLLKVLFLPLNLLTLGIFGWISNVLALYILVSAVPYFKLYPYSYPGGSLGGFGIPAMDLSAFEVAIIASLLIGAIIHIIHWIIK
ncbi:phage holin family protein [Patescibacteria group bacterium]|nr:phage holin family protein [Patescibacteria group bacterium]